MSGKVHSDNTVAVKGVGCLRKYTLSTLLLQKCSCPWGWMVVVSGKVHSEHIVRFRAGGKQSRFELPSCWNI